MIRSVGAGSSGLNNETRRKKQPEQNIPFPKIGLDGVAAKQDEVRDIESQQAPLMVGVKPKAQLKSIFEEDSNVVKLNADGDRLEVSKRAISLAKEKLFG